MAAVLIIGNGGTDNDILDTQLTAYGHTVTRTTAALVVATPSLLEGYDTIWVAGVDEGTGSDQGVDLAALVVDLFEGNSPHPGAETPGLVVTSPSSAGPGTGNATTESFAVAIGMLSVEQREEAALAGINSAQQGIVLADDWQDFPVTNGFGPDVLDEEGDTKAGAESTFGQIRSEGVNWTRRTHIPNERAPFAGNAILREYVGKPNGDGSGNTEGGGRILGTAVTTGDTLHGLRPTTTAESNWVWFGWWSHTAAGADPSGFSSQLANAATVWAAGEYTEDYPTAGNQRSMLFGIDLDGLGDYQAAPSSVSWTEVTPGASTVLVETAKVSAGVVGAFGTVASSGDAPAGFTNGDDLTNVQLLVRITLDTSSALITPTLTDLKIIVEGDAVTITASPTDYFRGGHIEWTSGENLGLAQEVKDYDPTTRRLTFNLPAKKLINPCDTFDILPGCDKSLAQCRDKFNNVVNMRAEPFVPGKDRLFEYPDAN
jgi:hypothetical protein